jgi:hypothetical protein
MCMVFKCFRCTYIQFPEWFSMHMFPRSSLHSSPGLLAREPQVFFYSFPRSSLNNPLDIFFGSIGPRSSLCRPSMYICPGLPSAVSPICFAYRSPGLLFSILFDNLYKAPYVVSPGLLFFIRDWRISRKNQISWHKGIMEVNGSLQNAGKTQF